MIRRLAVSVVGCLLLAGCSTSHPSTTSTTRPVPRTTTSTVLPSTTGAPSTTAPSTTTTTAPGMIKVDVPMAGATVASPFVLSGSANVYEAALNAELTTSGGTVLSDAAFQATAGTGTWGTYSTSISYPAGHAGPATLTVFSISAKDGSRINQVVVPVTLR